MLTQVCFLDKASVFCSNVKDDSKIFTPSNSLSGLHPEINHPPPLSEIEIQHCIVAPFNVKIIEKSRVPAQSLREALCSQHI